jgi:putative oxidoreductase
LTTSVGAKSGASHFFLNLLRMGAGLSFMQHGAQKLFGALGGQGGAEFPSQFWLAGMLETWGGLLIVLGLFTRPLAFVLAGEMAWAYIQSHLPQSVFPIVNRGEPAILFMLIWLFIAANGGGAFSVDGLLALRRRSRVAS